MEQYELGLRVLTTPFNQKNDKAHNMEHVEEVLACAREINEKLELGIDDRLVCAVALCHDVMCWKDRDEHSILGAEWVADMSDEFPFSEMEESEVARVGIAVMYHRSSMPVPERHDDPLIQLIKAADRGNRTVESMIQRGYNYSRDKLGMEPEEGLNRAMEHLLGKYSNLPEIPLWDQMYGPRDYPTEIVEYCKSVDLTKHEMAYQGISIEE